MVATTDSSPTDVKLLKDDNWKLIQQNTFTRWVNQQLKQAVDTPQIENLATDFSDGITLIKLSEILSGRNMPRYNKKPIMRTQKLDNISLVLNFLQKEEGIKIVNIDSTHIADQNLKLILGLVWTLILHYSLSHRLFALNNNGGAENTTMGMSEDEEGAGRSGKTSKESPKQRLLAWIQGKLPQHPISNFTSSWNDGISLGALVDACSDGRFKEWQNWSPNNALDNTQKAMLAAEQTLGVEKLITPEELTNPNVDEKSVMTYLAQFPCAKPRDLEPVDSELHLHLSDSSSSQSAAVSPRTAPANNYEHVSVWGRGLLPSGTAACEELFVHVDNCADDVQVGVLKDNSPVPVQPDQQFLHPFELECRRQSFKYTPRSSGRYDVVVKAGDVHLGKSPYKVVVGPKNLSSIRAIGPGLEGGVAEQKAVFYVDTHGRTNYLEFSIEGPSRTEILCADKRDGTALVEYTPHDPGRYVINITELDTKRHIRDSPFVIWVDPAHSLPHPELQRPLDILPKGLDEREKWELSEPVEFSIPKSDDVKFLDVAVYDPTLSRIPVKATMDSSNHYFSFTPELEGKHIISVVADKLAVAQWPHQLTVAAHTEGNNTEEEDEEEEEDIDETFNAKAQLVSATGPGLAIGVAGRPNIFAVSNADELGVGELTVEIDGPGNAEVSTREQPADNTYQVEYTVQTPGLYTVNILFNDMPIGGSPFKVFVKPAPTESLSKSTPPISPAQELPYDYLQMSTPYRPVQNAFQEPFPEGGNHHKATLLQYDGDAHLVRASGGGLGHFVPNEPAEFLVDTSATEMNTLFVGIITSHGPTDELNVRHTGGGKYLVNYTVPKNTDALIFVKYGEQQIPGSPFNVHSRPDEDDDDGIGGGSSR